MLERSLREVTLRLAEESTDAALSVRAAVTPRGVPASTLRRRARSFFAGRRSAIAIDRRQGSWRAARRQGQ